jgi:hypothetical protein
MSYDVGVWNAKRLLTTKEAQAVYGDPVKSAHLAASKNVDVFYRKLTKRYAEIDDVPEAKLEDCPWSIALDRSPRHVLMPMRFSFASDMVPEIVALALEHGLDTYDPQDNKLYSAHDSKTTAPVPKTADNPRVTAGAAATRLREALAPTLAEMGFSPVRRNRSPGVPVQFERAATPDLTLYIGWGIEAGSAKPYIAVSSKEVDAIYAKVAPDPPKVLATTKTMRAGLRGLYYAGEGNEAWMLAHGFRLTAKEAVGDKSVFEDAVCHEKCITRAIKHIRKNVVRFGPPCLATLDSLAKLDDYFSSWMAKGWYADHDELFIGTIVAKLAHGDRAKKRVGSYRARVARLPSQWNEINVYYRKSSPQQDYERLLGLLGWAGEWRAT